MTEPESGTRIPDSTLIVVDLPAPFGPMYPTISPFLIEKEILLIAFISLYFLLKKVFKVPNFPFSLIGTLKVLLICLTSMNDIFSSTPFCAKKLNKYKSLSFYKTQKITYLFMCTLL